MIFLCLMMITVICIITFCLCVCLFLGMSDCCLQSIRKSQKTLLNYVTRSKRNSGSTNYVYYQLPITGSRAQQGSCAQQGSRMHAERRLLPVDVR